jgi:glycerophosphoryl diester phosphodiesterase
VMHDETFERTTNGIGRVWETNLAEVKKLDAGRGQRVPTLKEVIDLVRPTQVQLCLELKYEPFTKDANSAEIQATATAKAVVKILQDAKFVDRVMVTSFSQSVLQLARKLEPRLPAVLDPTPQDGTLTPKQVLDQVLPCANIVAYYYPYIDKDFMDTCRLAGITVWAWDPDKEEDIQRMVDLGVDGVMTNRTDTLNQILRRK